MKKTYKIEVDCANCASIMEDAIRKLEGIENAVINFMTQKLTVEFAEDANVDSVMKSAMKTCKKIESDCEIYI